ncbi:MAG TPA: hypothetical protein VIX12_05235, partial [Candidatus Binataceae bacterium]
FQKMREIFAQREILDIWLASQDGRDFAAMILLRDRDQIHAKWAARATRGPDGANHLMFISVVEEYANKAEVLDLGRADLRNNGLNRFKRELGASSAPLPYGYFPAAPRNISSEALTGSGKLISRVWRHLPIPVTRAIGAAIYGYLG